MRRATLKASKPTRRALQHQTDMNKTEEERADLVEDFIEELRADVIRPQLRR